MAVKTTKVILLVIGISLLIIQVIWIFNDFKEIVQAFAILPDDFDYGYSSAQFSEEVKALLKEGNQKVITNRESYSTYFFLHEVAGWLSFAMTASITIVTGSFSIRQPSADTQESSKPGRFYLLGFLAAVASVCTLLSSKLNDGAMLHKSKAQELVTEIASLTEKLKNDPSEESNIILELRNLITE